MFNQIKKIEGVLIPKDLFSTMEQRASDLFDKVVTLRTFSGEALIYALIEYSAFNRAMTDDERYIYLYQKAFLYDTGGDCKELIRGVYYEADEVYIKVDLPNPF